jgi:hypothetical protein
MSVSARSVFLDTALALDDEKVERALALPRNTLSAAAVHRRSRGLPAIFISFDRKVQSALQRLCFERMTVEARLRAETERLQANEQNLMREPDVLTKIRVAIADNEYNIRRLAGAATPQILSALQDPEIRENLHLAVACEEDADTVDKARLWRRNLDRISIPVKIDAPYRYASHDSPTARGHRDLHNDLNRRTGEEGFSYYQRQQLKYGRGRRGSTSISGAWEAVFADSAAAPAAGAFMYTESFGNAPPPLDQNLSPRLAEAGWAAGPYSYAAPPAYVEEDSASSSGGFSQEALAAARSLLSAHARKESSREMHLAAQAAAIAVAGEAVAPIAATRGAPASPTRPALIPAAVNAPPSAPNMGSTDPKLAELLARAKSMLHDQMPH